MKDTEFLQTFQGVLEPRRAAYCNLANSDCSMNMSLVDSLVQAVRALSEEERALLEEKLFYKADEPTTDESATLAVRGSSFDCISDEPDLYSSELTKGSIAMSPLVEQILQAVQDLPEADQRQVLDFIEFLIAQHQKLTHIEPDTASQ